MDSCSHESFKSRPPLAPPSRGVRARASGGRVGAEAESDVGRVMEGCEFESWLQQVSRGFVSLSDGQRNAVLDVLIASSGPTQLRHLSTQLESLLKRDFLRLLPLELSFHLLKWLDPRSLLTCCLVCRSWNKVVNGCSEVWLSACRELGWRVPDECSTQDGRHWKCAYIQANRRLRQLRKQQAFETSSLLGHSARVYALYYKDGLLCTATGDKSIPGRDSQHASRPTARRGEDHDDSSTTSSIADGSSPDCSDDLSAKLWDVKTGQCVYGIQTHTCADVKFDEHKLVTASFDNTLACWEWSTGKRTRHFRGHTAAVFSVDYRDELDILVSGSADFAVKIWSLSSAACLNTLTGHSEWVTKVVFQQSMVESLMHSPGEFILLSADKYEIKVWPISREINCQCLRTLSVSDDRTICLQPQLHCDGRTIMCASDLGVIQWDFSNYQQIRVMKCGDAPPMSLLRFGETFALLLDQRSLCVVDVRSERCVGTWPLPSYRRSKRGSSFLAGEAEWLHGFSGGNDQGLVFATSMPDHSIHLVFWKGDG